ncbi:immunoglobulin superfamily member 3-like [Paramormyrops kingsleyae]|uniref:immunoglobulin superfamily member 3-like n=1 Tax=Paramormyrops kingsleyae TaxID=1676925 RepID=UPI003B974C97
MRIPAFLIASVLLGSASGKRVVTVQSGPLVRTEGSHVTIWCNVTGHKEGVEQDFEWSMYLPSAPEREIRIVSTSQSNYAYAVYAQRVNNKEIYVERLGKDAALLHITKLETRDQGQFECYTPNTDGEYLGSYSAKTNLTVIPDTLSVTSVAQSLNKVEGDTLQLTCEVTRQTSQHSHLSVGWFLRSPERDSPPQDLVTLSRDFVLRAGNPYKQRFAFGDLRLDKTSSASYRLSIYRLQPADQGLLYCEAAEWIQDPDQSWYAMTRKQSEKTMVKVQPTDRDFGIQVSTERRSYTTGEPLELRCAIDAQNVPDRYFSVSWVFSSSPVAVVGPNAVPVLGADYVAREAAGQITVRKESAAIYLLRLQRLRVEDSGKYICRVTEREKTPTGDFIDRTKRSRNVQITVQPLRSNMTVFLVGNSTEVLEGEPVQLTCSVRALTDKTGSVSVTWQWMGRKGTAVTQDVVTIDREGTVRLGPAYRERSTYGEIRAERVRADTFTLQLYNSVPGDEGQYKCVAMEWIQASDLTWEKIGERSASKPITIKTVESSFFVSASSRTPSVTYGDSFDLQCIVKPRYNPHVPVTVTWRFQPPEGELRDLVTFARDGTLRWGEEQIGLGTRASTERSPSNSNFRLSVTGAGQRESGTFQCSAELWRKNYDNTWTKIANRTSNLLGINVFKPVSKLRLHHSNQSLSFVEDSRVRINCSIASQTVPEAQHAVLWYVHKGGEPEAGAELLLKVRRDAAVEYGAYADEERLERRAQPERLSPQLYALTLHRAETSDSGTYFCQVEEWLQDPGGAWYRLALEASGFTRVAVHRPEVRLQVEEAEFNVTVTEAESIRLGCSVSSQSTRDSRFSVSWYVARAGEGAGEQQCIFSIGHDAVFGNGNCSPAEDPGPNSRLQFQRMTSDLYSLTIQGARPSDSGSYYCRVEEWFLNPRNVWYRLTTNDSGVTVVTVLEQASTLQSVICSNDSLFYFVFFYPFPIFGILLMTVLLVRYKARNLGKSQEGKNGVPLLWIKEPHINYSPTCLDPPALSLHPGSVE